ncbi:MAG: hypothetical protein O3A14_12485 [Cyanobacteria bacterium]|nr:hypothetical protein [Cyanobacteriota bacterium]
MSIETTVMADHLFRLPEELPVNSRIRIIIETIEEDETNGDFQPRTPLGGRLLALRNQYIASGGKLLNGDELDAEMDQRRGGVMDE